MITRNPAYLIEQVLHKNTCIPAQKLMGLWDYVKEAPEGDIL
jgi:hypothetical protein